MKTAELKDLELQIRAEKYGIKISVTDARILRRAEMTLRRWDEKRCGWSTPGPFGASYALVRDDEGCECGCKERPYLEIHPNKGLNTGMEQVPDLERGAIKRIEAVCKKYAAPNGSPLKYYHQSDPRGASLYIELPHIALNDTNYNRSLSCAVRNN